MSSVGWRHQAVALAPPSPEVATSAQSRWPAIPAARHAAPTRLGRLTTERRLVFLLPFTVYLVVGWLLDIHYHSYLGDAISRMANAFYVLHSRDPHLAAIGFVWNPLPSLVQLPLLLFSSFIPQLTHEMLSASICSAAAMAGAAYQLRCLLEDWGVARTARLVLTGFFALNPMIVYYGGNGMSEALYVFTILLTCRYLLRWMRRGDLVSLVYAAGSLGVAYLARNEAAGAAILGGVAVVAVSFLRARGSRRNRTLTALTDGVIFLAPVVTSIAGWATASYVITGAWFEQFSSIYGNSSQIRLQPNPVDTGPARLAEALHAIAAFAPLLPVLGVVAIVVCWRRRDLGVVAVLAIVGGGLTFDLGSYYVNSLIWSLRFYILSIPLGILLTAALFAGAPTLPMSRWRTDRYGGAAAQRQPRGTLPGWIALVGLVAMLVPTLFTSGWAMENPTLGSLEQQGLGFVLSSHPNGSDLTYKVLYSHVQAIDGYLAAMHLSNGQILMDDFSSCAPDLIVQSDQPRLFVIPNDRDFERTLAAPLTFHAHYMMVPQPVGQSSLEVIGRTYPNIWANGDGIATLVHNFPAGGACPDFRLYRVLVTPQTTS